MNRPPTISYQRNSKTPQAVSITKVPEKFSAPLQIEAPRKNAVISFTQKPPTVSPKVTRPREITITKGPAVTKTHPTSEIVMPQPNQFASTPNIVITKKSPPPPPRPVDLHTKLSLLSFANSFVDNVSFNETDLETLGLDLDSKDPLLPKLHSILSESPLLTFSAHKIPQSYGEVAIKEKPEELIPHFSEQTLLFIFYSQGHSKLQFAAADELKKRGFTYNPEKGTWMTNTKQEWDVSQWTEHQMRGEADIKTE